MLLGIHGNTWPCLHERQHFCQSLHEQSTWETEAEQQSKPDCALQLTRSKVQNLDILDSQEHSTTTDTSVWTLSPSDTQVWTLGFLKIHQVRLHLIPGAGLWPVSYQFAVYRHTQKIQVLPVVLVPKSNSVSLSNSCHTHHTHHFLCLFPSLIWRWLMAHTDSEKVELHINQM